MRSLFLLLVLVTACWSSSQPPQPAADVVVPAPPPSTTEASAPETSGEPPVTVDDVLGLMAKIPQPEGCVVADDPIGDLWWPPWSKQMIHIGRPICRPGGFERTSDAPRIAAAIAAAVNAPGCAFFCRRELSAAIMAVFAAFDSGNTVTEHGAWHLPDAPVDPMLAAPIWAARAGDAIRVCMDKPYSFELHHSLGAMLIGRCAEDTLPYEQCVRSPKSPVSRCSLTKSNWRTRVAETFMPDAEPGVPTSHIHPEYRSTP